MLTTLSMDAFLEFFGDISLDIFSIYEKINVIFNGNTFNLLVALFAFNIFGKNSIKNFPIVLEIIIRN